MKIRFTQIKELYNFVSLAQCQTGKVTLMQGNYVVDGKSALGLFSLNLLEPVTLVMDNGNYKMFEDFKVGK